MFCPKCGGLLRPRGGELYCTCGYTNAGKVEIKEKFEKKRELEVIDPSKDDEHLPIDPKAECPKCKKYGARFYTVQTRASDEPETKFYKCLACLHNWRDYK